MIPCTVWIYTDAGWCPVYSTMTYRGAKRIKKKIQQIRPETEVKISEVWHPKWGK